MSDALRSRESDSHHFDAHLLAHLDPELAAATALVIRPDLGDIARARQLISKLRNSDPSAEAHAEGRITIEERLIPRGSGEELLRLRIYRPVSTSGLQPAVLFFHSGAFVLGDLETEHGRCVRYAADGGCTVISVEYRLAPEHPYPAGLEDCFAALRWTHENADSLGVDRARVAVAGNSAGGGLAAGVALLARERGGPAIALQMLIYPVLDDRQATVSMTRFDATPIFDNRNTRQMWSYYLGARKTAPVFGAPARETNLAGLPDAYILTAEFDPLRDEALDYGIRLLQAGVSVDLRNWVGTYHGFDHQVAEAAISQRAIADQVFHLQRILRQ